MRPALFGAGRTQNLERETRFELATPTLARLCSTTELFPLSWIRDFNSMARHVKRLDAK